MVLPNCESLCIPWMLAEKNDWVPRKAAPFVRLSQEGTKDLMPPIEKPCSQPVEAKQRIDLCRQSSSGHSESKQQKLDTNDLMPTIEKPCSQPVEAKPKTDLSRQPSTGHSESKQQKLDDAEPEQTSTGELTESPGPTNAINLQKRSTSSQELATPLLIKNEPWDDFRRNGETPAVSSQSRSVNISENQDQMMEHDDAKPKRMGTRARMLDLGKKMGEKLERRIEEKRKHIVEKMRGPT